MGVELESDANELVGGGRPGRPFCGRGAVIGGLKFSGIGDADACGEGDEVRRARGGGGLGFAIIRLGAVPLRGIVGAAGPGEALRRRAVRVLVFADGTAGSVNEREEGYEHPGPAHLGKRVHGRGSGGR